MRKHTSQVDRSRRKFLTATGVSAAMVGTAGCLGFGDGGGGDNGGARTIEAWAWTPHDEHLKQAAESFDSEHTVEGQEKADMNDLWTTGLQSQSGLPPLALIRAAVLKNAARQGGLESTGDIISEYEDGLFEAAQSRNIIDGEYYSSPNDLGPFILIYNREVFEEAGLPTEPDAVREELVTWNEYMDAAETIESETGAKMLAFGKTEDTLNSMGGGMRTQAGGGWYNSDGEFAFNQPANVEGYEKLVELLDYAEPLEYFTSAYYNAYAQGDVATAVVPGWMIAFWKADVDAEGVFRITTLPRFEEGGHFGTNQGGAGAAIPTFVDEADKEVAIEFIRHWHFSEEGVRAKLEVGIPPTYDPGGDIFDLEDEYFGGQAIWQPVLESADDSPPDYVVPNADVDDLKYGVLQEVTEEGRTVQEALDERQDNMWDTLDDEDKQIETVD